MEDKLLTKNEFTDAHRDHSEATPNLENASTGCPKSLQDGENDCNLEKSSNHETYFAFCDYKAQEDNQVILLFTS